MRQILRLAMAAAWIFLVALSGPASATIIGPFNEEPTKFGTLNQADTNCPNVNCGATAAIESFVYLQTVFSTVYTTPLVPKAGAGPIPTAAEQAAVANDVATNFMKNCCANSAAGTLIEDFILGKRDYLESKDPGKTVFNAQINFAWRTNPAGGTHPGTAKPAFVQDNTIPTLAFIANELSRGEDVEVFMFNSNGGCNGPAAADQSCNHYITLTGITYNDANNTGTFSFVDPLGGGRDTKNITGLTGGFIQTDYKLGGVNTLIVHAVSESPIPEPSTVLLLGAGLAALAFTKRKRVG
ncbi:MAG TPA: PEP-CTERM sorting domain-containing protein [Nitrospirales bacterium]|jgi:hypothetical protein